MRPSSRGPGPLSLAEVTRLLGGRVCGDSSVMISQVGTIDGAGPGDITFLSNPRYRARLSSTRASAVVLGVEAEHLIDLPRIVSDNPYAYFARLSALLNPRPDLASGIHPNAVVHASATIDPTCQVAAGAVISANAVIGARSRIGAGCIVGEDVRIRQDTVLHPRVVIYPDCIIGSRVILHSGVVIGADGFGIAWERDQWLKIPQIGTVVLEDDVEVGANTTIDRGTIENTHVETGVKLDNQIQIGHNCRIGAHTAMAGCVAVAGSANIGKRCTIGAGAIILGHLSIADGTQVSAATVITKSITKAGTYSGFFPFDDNRAWTRNAVLVKQLSEYAERIRQMDLRIAELEGKHD